MADEEAGRELDTWLELDRDGALVRLRAMLRSGDDLPQAVRNHLADMLEPTGPSRFRLDLKRRGKRGRPPKAVDLHVGDVMRMQRDEWGEEFKVALYDVMKRYGVKRHQIIRAFRLSRNETGEP